MASQCSIKWSVGFTKLEAGFVKSYIRPNMRVARVSKYLTGRAHAWYMRTVAKDERKWTLKKFFEELFNHCFPVDFRSQQRRKFFSFSQGNRSIKDYRTDIQVLADSVGDISERLLIVRFWEGARVAIQKEWAHDGYDPETASMRQLVRAAVNYEQAQKLVDSIEKNKQPRERTEKTKTQAPKPSQRGREQQKPKQKQNGVHWAEKSDIDKTANLKKVNGNGGGKKNWNNANKSNNLTRAQKDEYRAQGKCFTCGETTHLSKDCPQNNSVKPKWGVGAASVSFGEVERLRNLRDANALGLFSLKFEQPRLTPEYLAALDDVLVERMRAELHVAVPFSWDCLDDPCEESGEHPLDKDRFVISPVAEGWVIVDRHLEIHHELLRTQLLDSDFSLIEFIGDRNFELLGDQHTVNQPKRVFRRLRCKRELDVALEESASYFPECEEYFDRYSAEDLPDSVRIFSHFWGHAKMGTCTNTPIDEILVDIQRQFSTAAPYFFDSEQECEEVHSLFRFELDYSDEEFLTVWDTYHNREFNLSFKELLSSKWNARMYIERAYVDYEERRYRNPYPEDWLETNPKEVMQGASTSPGTPPWMAPGTENEAYFANRRKVHFEDSTNASEDSDIPGLQPAESSDDESTGYDSESEESDSEMPYLYSDSDSDDEDSESDSDSDPEMPGPQQVQNSDDSDSDYGSDIDETDPEMPHLYSASESESEESDSDVDCYIEVPRSRWAQNSSDSESDSQPEFDSDDDEFFSACDWEEERDCFQSDNDPYVDMPDLYAASDSDSSDSEDEPNEIFDALDFPATVHDSLCSTAPESLRERWDRRMDKDDHWEIGDFLADGAQAILEVLQPYPGDNFVSDEFRRRNPDRFEVCARSEDEYLVWDEYHHELTVLPKRLLLIPQFRLGAWYAARCRRMFGMRKSSPDPVHLMPVEDLILGGIQNYLYNAETRLHEDLGAISFRKIKSRGKRKDPLGYLMSEPSNGGLHWGPVLEMEQLCNPNFILIDWIREVCAMKKACDVSRAHRNRHRRTDRERTAHEIHAFAAGPSRRKSKMTQEGTIEYQRTASNIRDFARAVPQPMVIVVQVNGNPVTALLDSGSLGDFMSTTLVDQLKLKTDMLAKPLTVTMAVSGSRTVVNHTSEVRFQYQGIDERRRFDVMNIANYDLILGTPFLFQHEIVFRLNPPQIGIGSLESKPIRGEQVKTLPSLAAELYEDKLEKLREELRQYSADICLEDASKTPLPPLRAINHKIPLKDEKKTYSFRPSKCPEALKDAWHAKRDAYLESGRWKMQPGYNAVPMLMLRKPNKPGDTSVRLRTVFDCRERNQNTVQISSPLPDIEGILRNVAGHKYKSTLDNKDAYEQIRVEPEHVERTLFNTPDGTMASLVIQQGDRNGGATYQALMNHLFAEHIGRFMDVYLDDIFIYSNTAEEHVEHVKTVIDILRQEKLYLSKSKIDFFVDNVTILGHVIDSEGIKMDPHKVDSILKWPVPTNSSLLGAFIGSVGYLAPDCEGIRVAMGVLTPLTGNVPWRWSFTEQRAFEAIKASVAKWRDHHRKNLDYSPNADPIFLATDGSLTGCSGVVLQGKSIDSAHVIAFWSGKFNSAQQNYPVHDIELLAIVESLKKFRHLLLGAKFKILTDHKALQHFLTQKKLSARQSRWLETLGEFDFEIEYIPGTTNVLADALSRIYSADLPGTMRAPSEFVPHDEEEVNAKAIRDALSSVTRPVQVGDAVFANFAGMTPVEQTDKPKLSRGKKTRDGPKIMPKVSRLIRDPETGRFSRPDADLEGETSLKAPEMISPSKALPGKEKKTSRSTKGKQKETIPSVPSGQKVSAPESSKAPSSSADISQVQTPEEEILTAVAPKLVDIISEGDPSMDLPSCLKNRYSEDAFFKNILENPTHYKNFECKDGLIFLKEHTSRFLCIPDVLIGKRSAREIVITHAHSILAHLGPRKTMYYLKDNVWWKTMLEDVKIYCDSCQVCKGAKSSNERPYGLLHPLQPPTRPWESIGVDFVGPLTPSSNRLSTFDMIMVIIDHLTSMVHLVPTKQTYRAKDIAEAFFEQVYSKHGLPEIIVSDRDSLFTSIFWDKLHALVGTKLRMSSAYHPQSDGATERANRTMVQMLRSCISPNQKDWVKRLPGIEFAMNSARSETTGFSPFFLNTGQMPQPMIWDAQSEYPGVRVFAQKMKDAIVAAHDAIIEARIGDITEEWAVDKILGHAGRGRQAIFLVLWKHGDTAWFPYKDVSHLKSLSAYLEAYGVHSIEKLPPGKEATPEDTQVSVGALGINTSSNSGCFSNPNMENHTELNDNPSGDWTSGHLELFRAYAKYLRTDNHRSLHHKAPEQYNVWVYEVRKENVGARDLPPFTDDYVGPVPRNRVDRRDESSASAEKSAAELFMMEFARGALSTQRQQAEFQNRAALEMLKRGTASKGYWKGKGGKGFAKRGPYVKREADTYYGEAYNESEVGEKRGRRERSDSPEARHVRRRSKSATEAPEDGEIIRDRSEDVFMRDMRNDKANAPVAGGSGSLGSDAVAFSLKALSLSNPSSADTPFDPKGKGKAAEVDEDDAAEKANPSPPDSDDEEDQLDEQRKKKKDT
ncbi:DNA/RNA polymerase [Mycena sanguinolenta]|uniref:RNA-directed DNA polymerase n=1 Tax=Mycena sanguinolenta TaxID=230812 RepID=A0A8H6ZDU8_9AGAR|nr:DNA/RNA polymerase [Mycena sanguinolenta]